jgi:hypothetical protein
MPSFRAVSIHANCALERCPRICLFDRSELVAAPSRRRLLFVTNVGLRARARRVVTVRSLLHQPSSALSARDVLRRRSM